METIGNEISSFPPLHSRAVIPSLAVQHFFILFEVLRSLFADVDPGKLLIAGF